MARPATLSVSPPRTKRFIPRLSRVLLPVLMLISAGLFMGGTLANVRRFTDGNFGGLAGDFCVLFVGGALYAAGVLYAWYYAALTLTGQWLNRLVARLEEEAKRPERNLPLSW